MPLDEPPATDLSPILLLAALLLLGLLLQTAQPTFIASVLDRLGQLFKSRAWQALGLALAGLIYIPLALQALRRGAERGMTGDLAAVAAFCRRSPAAFCAGRFRRHRTMGNLDDTVLL